MAKKPSEPSQNGSHKKYVVATLPEVAAFFGMQYGTVLRDWPKQGMPGTKGNYDLSEIAKWKVGRLIAEHQQRSASNPLEEQKLREEVLTKRIKRRQLQNRLIPLNEAVQEVSLMMTRIRDRLEQFPDELEMDFPKETRKDNKCQIQNKIERLLKELSEFELPSPEPSK